MAVILPPNSTGTTVANLTSGGKDFQQAILVDATTPTQGLAISAAGAAMVAGVAAAGAAIAGNPVLVGGSDGANARTLLTDTSGREIVVGAAASGAAVTGNPVLIAGQDGTNAVTLKTASAANLAVGATAGNGAAMVTRPADWAVNNVAGAATQATITKAAGAGTVKHVATSISGQISTVGTAQAAQLVFNLRDGATGAGTVLWSVGISLGTNATWGFYLSGLNVIGSAATAMTLETAAAPVAAAFASVSLTGYDVT